MTEETIDWLVLVNIAGLGTIAILTVVYLTRSHGALVKALRELVERLTGRKDAND